MDDIVPVIICENYSDYLDCTLQQNRSFFKNYHVITTEADTETQEVCKKHGVSCELFEPIPGKFKFNKAGMLRQLQLKVHELYPESWILILDADIALPDDFCTLWETHHPNLNKSNVYGMKRIDYWTHNEYKLRGAGRPYAKCAGYFQLYFDKTKLYDKTSNDATMCDMRFQQGFCTQCVFAEKHSVMHLGRDRVNHQGRVSKPWFDS